MCRECIISYYDYLIIVRSQYWLQVEDIFWLNEFELALIDAYYFCRLFQGYLRFGINDFENAPVTGNIDRFCQSFYYMRNFQDKVALHEIKMLNSTVTDPFLSIQSGSKKVSYIVQYY